jgi:hypothetical protein
LVQVFLSRSLPEFCRRLKNANFDAIDLKFCGFEAPTLRLAGFDAATLKLGGYDYFELTEAGFSAEELNDAGFAPESEVCDALQRAVQFVAGHFLLDFSVTSCRPSAHRGRIPTREVVIWSLLGNMTLLNRCLILLKPFNLLQFMVKQQRTVK